MTELATIGNSRTPRSGRGAAVCVVAALAAVIVSALVVAPAASAAVTKVRLSPFWVTFKAHQNTTFDQPTHNFLTDCYNRWFDQGSGTENWTIKSRRPTKVLALVTRGGVTFRIGTWNRTELVENPFVRLTSVIERASSYRRWVEPGRCGGAHREDQKRPRDCGTQRHGLKASFTISMDRKFRFQLGGDPPAKEFGYEYCPMTYPEQISELVLEDPAVPSKLAEFRSQRRKRIKIGWSKTFREEAPPQARPSSVSTDVAWSFTFERARKKKGGR